MLFSIMNLESFNFQNVSINYSYLIRTHYETCEQNFLFLIALKDPSLWSAFFLAATCTVGIVGVVGNALNIYVFLRKKVSYSHLNPLLIGLSISDLSVSAHEIVVVALPQIILTSGFPVTQQDAKSVMDMKMLLTFTWLTSCLSSLYFIIGISTERFIAVCWPLKTASILTSGRTRSFAVFIGVSAATVNAPLLVYDILWTFSDSDKWNCFLTPYYKLPLAIIIVVIPVPCITIFNSVIIWKTIKTHRERKRLTQQELKSYKVTKMLLWITSIFVLCVGCGVIHVFLIHDSLIQFQFGQFLVTLNSSVNYFIYCVSFRETFPSFLLTSCTNCKKTGSSSKAASTCCDSQKAIVADPIP